MAYKMDPAFSLHLDFTEAWPRRQGSGRRVYGTYNTYSTYRIFGKVRKAAYRLHFGAFWGFVYVPKDCTLRT
jgi:hypothetical protein